MDWYLAVLRKYAVFSGRARRREFWMFVLFNIVVSIALGVIDAIIGWSFREGAGVLGTLYSLAVIIPSIAVGVRRLHDTGRSGLWILIGLVPFIGWLVLLVFYVIDGERGPNQYGPDPKAGERGYVPASQYGTGTTAAASAQAAADWYADPTGRHQMRYWNGQAWTEHAADNGVATVDPLDVAPVAATQVEHPAWPAAPAATAVTVAAPAVTAPTPSVTPPEPSVTAPTPSVAEPVPPAAPTSLVADSAPPAAPAPSEAAATAVTEAPTPIVTPPSSGVPEAPNPPAAPSSPGGSPPSSAE